MAHHRRYGSACRSACRPTPWRRATAYFGLSVGEALLAILLANIIVLVPLTLNAFPGTKYGIPFPVLLRSSFG